MKKFVFASLILFITVTAFTQEERQPTDKSGGRVSIGIGPEFNMNSRENFAGGAVFGFDYGFLDSFAAGVSFTASHNFDEIVVLEPAALFRWYFLSKDYSGLFVQADVGAYFVLEGDDEMQTLFLGGLRGGYRFPLGKMYVEPYGRIGYPFAFGVGVLAGVRIR